MGRVYVAIGKSGLLKVGRTKNIVARIAALKSDFKRLGDVFERIQSFDEIEACYSAESVLIHGIAKTHKQYFGREWFEAGDFDAAVLLADRATDAWRNHKYPQTTAAQIAMGNVRREECAKAAIQRKEQKRQSAAAKLARRELRVLRRSEIAARHQIIA